MLHSHPVITVCQNHQRLISPHSDCCDTSALHAFLLSSQPQYLTPTENWDNQYLVSDDLLKDISSSSSSCSSSFVCRSGDANIAEKSDKPAKYSSDAPIQPDSGSLFCICQSKYEPGRVMISCDQCSEWFHIDCVQISLTELEKLIKWDCNDCKNVHSPPRKRQKMNGDPLDRNDGAFNGYNGSSTLLIAGSNGKLANGRGKKHKKGPRLCKFPGCDKNLNCRTYCGRHQKQKQRISKRGKVFTTLKNGNGSGSGERKPEEKFEVGPNFAPIAETARNVYHGMKFIDETASLTNGKVNWNFPEEIIDEGDLIALIKKEYR